MPKKLETICLGELLLRVTHTLDWPQDNTSHLYLGGSEYNVAAALSCWNQPVSMVTALPNNSMTESIINYIKDQGIHTNIRRVNDSRIGLFHTLSGSDASPAGAIYDRNYSAFSLLEPSNINWNTLIPSAKWFHVSAISPALSEKAYQNTLQALDAARNHGVTTSIDLKYRHALWPQDTTPEEKMKDIVDKCDCIIGNVWTAEKLLGIPLMPELVEQDDYTAYVEHAEYTAKEILGKHENCKSVALTFRFDKKNENNNYFSTFTDRTRQIVSAQFHAESVINRVGSGDCFAAGIIYGHNNELPIEETLDFATSAAYGHLQEETDITQQKIDEIVERIPSRDDMQLAAS